MSVTPGFAGRDLRAIAAFRTGFGRLDENEDFIDMTGKIRHAAAALRSRPAAAENDPGRDHREGIAAEELADSVANVIARDHIAVANNHARSSGSWFRPSGGI
jgi:hypothetical protein